jgi:hypothetical protein
MQDPGLAKRWNSCGSTLAIRLPFVARHFAELLQSTESTDGSRMAPAEIKKLIQVLLNNVAGYWGFAIHRLGYPEPYTD